MRSRSTVLALVTGCAALLIMAAPVLAALDTVSGHAYGESVNVTLLNAVNVTSGPLPSTGELTSNGSNSPLNNSALSVCVPVITCDVLSSGALTVHTEGSTGATGTVKSTASVANVDALTGILTATLISSECDIDSNGAATGFTTLTSASLDHTQNLAVNPGPNTQIALTGLVTGTLTLNEQTYDSGTNTLTVNAIHIHLTAGSFGSGDIIIAQSQCDASPAGPAPVIPESPLAVLLPLTALAVVGGMFVLTIRRRADITAR
jgi:hypothetical protein